MERSNLMLVLAAAVALAVSGCKTEEGGASPDAGVNPAGNTGGTNPAGNTGGTDPAGTTGGTDPAGTTGGTDPAGATGGSDPAGATGGSDPAGQPGGGGGGGGGALEKGAQCDPRNDQCDRGLICQEIGTDEATMEPVGRCFSTCDTLSDPSDCEANELCAPFAECADGAARCPGYCFPSDDCEPCAAEATCGRPATCLLASPITVCAPAGEAAVGEACDPSMDIFCAAPNLCIGGTCKAPCGGDACGQNDSCPEGESCIDASADYNGLNIKYCIKKCDIYAQTGCDAGEVCVVAGREPNGSIYGECTTYAGTVGAGVQGEACMPDDATYFGNCQPGHVCNNFFEQGGDPTCNAFCDVNNQTNCTGASGCALPFFNFDGLGACVGDCDVFGAVGQCGEGRACEFAVIGARGGNPEVALGLCAAGQETVATGGACQQNMNTGENNCEPGNICAALQQGGATTCIKLCDTIPDSGHTCPAGTMCLTEVFGDPASTVIGACVPAQGMMP
jgi:hypothetical protein